jgi:hypothetical protein
MDRYHSLVKVAIFVFVIVHAFIIVDIPLLPFIDLPNHLAEAMIYKYHGEEGNRIAQYYAPTPWYYPNTFHTVFCSLFPTVEIGNKVFHLLCILLLPFAVYLVIGELGGNSWYGLLALIFTYNYNLTYGFVGFAISIPTLVLLFYAILMDLRRNEIWTKAVIAVLLILLYLMHAQNALLGLLLYGIITLYAHRHSIKHIALRILTVPLPLVILIFSWWFTREGADSEESTLTYLMNYYSSSFFRDFPMRFRLVVFDNFQLFEGYTGIVLATFFFLCVFMPLVWYRAWNSITLDFFREDKNKYALLFFATVIGCYWFLPDKLPGQTPLFQRFCTTVMITFIIVGSVALKNVRSRALPVFSFVIVALYSILWGDYLYAFNKQNRSFNPEFFAGMENRSTIAGLIYDNSFRGRKVYIHYPNYFLVWNKGIAASKIIDYRFGVVRRVASEAELPFYHELIGEGYREMKQYSNLDYLLVKGKAPVDPDPNLYGFTLLREVPGWRLYMRTMPIAKDHRVD